MFGRPAAEAVAGQMDRLHVSRAFLMVSGTLNRTTDEIEKIRQALGPRCVGTFDAMPPHTPREAVVAAAEQARAAGADLIVTVGGGSITDGAKAVQLCLANDVRTADDIDRIRAIKGVAPPMKAPTVRQISVPTTIAGGEFSAIAGVTDPRSKVKEMLRHDLVMPRAAILDPAVTVHTPEWLWLSTGIRAVDHCVEGLCSREAHPFADAQALKGLSMLAQALPRVKADSCDLDARMDCQIGTWLSMGPLSSGVPMGASHGIGYVLGAVYDVPHGYTSCVMLPSVLRWNRAGQCRTAGAGGSGNGTARQGRRRRAGRFHPLARHAAQPAGRPDRACAFRPHRGTGDGDAMDTAQPAQDRFARAGARDSCSGRMRKLETRCIPASMLICARCSPPSSWRLPARP